MLLDQFHQICCPNVFPIYFQFPKLSRSPSIPSSFLSLYPTNLQSHVHRPPQDTQRFRCMGHSNYILCKPHTCAVGQVLEVCHWEMEVHGHPSGSARYRSPFRRHWVSGSSGNLRLPIFRPRVVSSVLHRWMATMVQSAYNCHCEWKKFHPVISPFLS